MTWVKLALALLKITGAIIKHIERRRLIKQGEELALFAQIEKMTDAIDRAERVRRGVDHSADSVSNDPNNRD